MTAPPGVAIASSTQRGSTTTPQAPASSAAAANAPPSTCSPGSPKKRSPGWTARESITARAGPPAARPPACSRTSSAPAVPAMRWALQCFTRRPSASRLERGRRHRLRLERRARHGDVVERLLAAARELLPLLVALPRDDHDVPLAGD